MTFARPSLEELAEVAFTNAPVAAAIVRTSADAPPAFLAVNTAFCDLVGCSAERAAQVPAADILVGLDQIIDSVTGQGPVASVAGAIRVDERETPSMLYGTSLGCDPDGGLVLVQVLDVAQDREVERALRESEKRVQDLVDHVNALIYIKAADGTYLIVNRHFEETYGVTRDRVSDCTNYDFFPEPIAAEYTANDKKVFETGVPMEFEEPRGDGGSWLSLKFPLFDMDGNIYAVGGISHDITSRSRAAALIRQAKDEAERANRAKSEFLSRVSHELRTPLNSILGFGQLLQMEPLPPSTRQHVDRVVKAGRHLLALINEVLEISRIEAQGASASTEAVDICRPLTEAIELVRPLARERDIEIVRDLHGGLYRSVLADEQRLTQAILNLLSNAIKYNRIGGTVKVFFREEVAGRLRLCVEDDGYGIPPADREKVFLPFERLGADRTGTEGTGLGLTLSRTLVETMGGALDIERSVEGEGTTFYIELPLVEGCSVVHPPDAADGGDASGRMGIAEGTVLYIEDNLSNLELVNGLLARFGDVRVIPAVQGQLGIELAARHRPDLILLDLHLPDLDGDEVMRRLRADERTAGIPVIVLSADATPAQVQRLKRSGALEYVTKPIDVPGFLKAVESVLGSAPPPAERLSA